MVVIDILFDDYRLRGLKTNFNEKTVDAVELAMDELMKCNGAMKDLLTGLTTGLSVLSRGWLRQALDRIAEALSDRRLQFDGMACRNQIAINFRREIYLSAF